MTILFELFVSGWLSAGVHQLWYVFVFLALDLEIGAAGVAVLVDPATADRSSGLECSVIFDTVIWFSASSPDKVRMVVEMTSSPSSVDPNIWKTWDKTGSQQL